MPKSLTTQIRDAEQQVLNRQREVGIRTATLTRKTYQQMTAPGTLLLMSGIGFIIGELTKRRPQKLRAATTKSHVVETTPLKTVLNLITSAQTLYAALPLAWMMKSYYRPGASAQTAEFQSRTAELQSRRSAIYGPSGRRRRLTDS